LGLDLESGPVDESLGEIDQSDLTIRRVVAIEDFDGDEIVDLLVESSHREGVFDRTTRYELFYGRREDGRVAFGGAPATGVGLDTAIGGVRTVDMDGDGRRDLAAGSIDFGLGSIVSALLTGAVDVDVRFYRLSEENRFPEQPSTTRDARIEFDLSQGRASIP